MNQKECKNLIYLCYLVPSGGKKTPSSGRQFVQVKKVLKIGLHGAPTLASFLVYPNNFTRSEEELWLLLSCGRSKIGSLGLPELSMWLNR
uniref:Uncharacterized protein n=1 Tax=Oryza brachyantha TaxID=4533 RepID=J3MDQ9_ORYBR